MLLYMSILYQENDNDETINNIQNNNIKVLLLLSIHTIRSHILLGTHDTMSNDIYISIWDTIYDMSNDTIDMYIHNISNNMVHEPNSES